MNAATRLKDRSSGVRNRVSTHGEHWQIEYGQLTKLASIKFLPVCEILVKEVLIQEGFKGIVGRIGAKGLRGSGDDGGGIVLLVLLSRAKRAGGKEKKLSRRRADEE